jgi:hypothetical protein
VTTPDRALDVDGMRRARAQGATLRKIATDFNVSPTTVMNHTRGIVLEGGDVVAGHGRSEIVSALDTTDHGKS